MDENGRKFKGWLNQETLGEKPDSSHKKKGCGPLKEDCQFQKENLVEGTLTMFGVE